MPLRGVVRPVPAGRGAPYEGTGLAKPRGEPAMSLRQGGSRDKSAASARANACPSAAAGSTWDCQFIITQLVARGRGSCQIVRAASGKCSVRERTVAIGRKAQRGWEAGGD